MGIDGFNLSRVPAAEKFPSRQTDQTGRFYSDQCRYRVQDAARYARQKNAIRMAIEILAGEGMRRKGAKVIGGPNFSSERLAKDPLKIDIGSMPPD